MSPTPSTIVEVIKFEVRKDWIKESDDQIWVLETHIATLDGDQYVARFEFADVNDLVTEMLRICAF
jgi:hypothetical protein